MRHLFAVALGTMLAAGCMGDVGDTGMTPGGGDDTMDPGGGGQGKSLYVANVHPIMARCASAACHSTDAVSAALGKFYAVDATEGYNKITQAPTIIGSGNQAFSSIAPIITKIEAGHQAVTYSPDEKSKITTWLAQEVEDRKDATPMGPPPPDPKEVLRTFSGCLTIEDFTTAQMTQKWSTLAAQNNQKCLNCHQGGIAGFVVSTDPALYFQLVTEQSAQLLKYFTVDSSVTPAKVIINTGSFMNAGVTLAGHPRFDPTTNAGMTALKAWYDLAIAKGTCGAPTIKD